MVAKLISVPPCPRALRHVPRPRCSHRAQELVVGGATCIAQTTSRGENGLARKHRARGICRCCSLSSSRSTDDGPSACIPALRWPLAAPAYSSSPFSPPASSAGWLPWVLVLAVGSGRGQGASGDPAFRPSSKPRILDRLLFLPAFPSRGPWVSVEPVSVGPPSRWPT